MQKMSSVPERITISIIITSQKLSTAPFISKDLQWLIDITKQVVGVFGTEVAECIDVLFDSSRGKSAE